MTDRNRHRSLWLIPVTLLVGVGVGPATALSAPPDQARALGISDAPDPEPLEVPRRKDQVTIGDGLGNRRSDLTYGEFLDKIEELEDAQPAPEGTMYLYGLLPSGEIGVTGVCTKIPALGANQLPADGPNPSGWECRPVPELERPGHNVAGVAP